MMLRNIWAVVWFVFAAPAVADESIGRDGQKPTTTIQEINERARSRLTRIYIHLGFPRLIDAQELEYYSMLLDLTENQAVILQSLFQSYSDAMRELVEHQIQPLNERGADIPRESGGWFADDKSVDALEVLMKERDRIVRRMTAADDQLFAQIEPVLAEYQKPLLERARKARQRVQCRVFMCWIPAGYLDLFEILYGLKKEGFAVPIADPDFDMALQEYESLATGFLATHHQLHRQLQMESARLDVVLYSLRANSPADDAESESSSALWTECMQRRMRLFKPRLRMAERLHDLNAGHVRILSDMMPAETAREFQRRFREAAYVDVYPHDSDLSRLCDRLTALTTVDEKQQQQLNVMTSDYLVRWQRLSDDMVKAYLDWRRVIGAKRAMNHDEFAAYQQTMRDLNEKRARTALALVNGAGAALNETQLAELDDEFGAVTPLLEEAIDEPVFPSSP